MEQLFQAYNDRLKQCNTRHIRYLMDKVFWNDRLSAIVGARGTGKTTLMLQYIKMNLDPKTCIYMSLDETWFMQNRLLDTVQRLRQEGVFRFFIDEVHKYPYTRDIWAQEIKNAYDRYSDIRIVISGTSALRLYQQQKADLSRRMVDYELYGLSFREFLKFEGALTLPVVSFDDLLKQHVEIASDIVDKLKIMPLFRKYLQIGYFPYYKENEQNFHRRLLNTVNAVLEADLPAVDYIEYGSVIKLKRLLNIIAGMAPFSPNMTKLGSDVGMQRTNLPKSLHHLERARMIALLEAHGKTPGVLSKPSKIYLDNTNLAFALKKEQSDAGNLRETFFYNQLRVVADSIHDAAKGDFTVNDRYTFEVGGQGKRFTQIADMPDSYLAVADTEIGMGNRIPLWMFGLLY